MKKIYFAMFAAASSMLFTACGGSNDEPAPNKPAETDGVEVTIATSAIQTKAAASLEFKGNDKMNIFAKTFGRIDAPNIVDGVVATYDGSKWTMEPKVIINPQQKNAFVYAVAPYDPAYTDLANIPVNLSKQVDLLYTNAYGAASLTTPGVKLNMQHALSLLTFNIAPVNYSGAGKIESIELEGESFYTTGSLNVSTGKITKADKGKLTVSVGKTIPQGGFTSDLPGIWSMPMNSQGTVNATFTIDGKKYELMLPDAEVKQGYQYIFRLVLTNNGLEFDPSKTEVISLNVLTDEKPEFQGYGMLTLKASGSTMHAPTFTGDAVFGNINASGNHAPYAPNAAINGLSQGQDVVVESWNSTGFTLESLEGIESIDLSAYN